MKKIFLYNLEEAQPAFGSKFHGGATYIEIVFYALSAKMQENFSLIACYNSKLYIAPSLLAQCQEKKVPLLDLNQSSLREIITKYGVNFIYPISDSLYPQIPSSVTVSNTMFGLRLLEKYTDSFSWKYESRILPKTKAFLRFLFQQRLWSEKYEKEKKRLVHTQYKPVTISQHSKFSLKNLFPSMSWDSIPVFYAPLYESVPGYNCDSFTELPITIKKQAYFLMVSGNRWIKNPLRAALAFDHLISQGQCLYPIVITGVVDDRIYRRHLKNFHHFVFLNYVDRSLLNTLHQNAYAFIYPSLNEGFGYPPIESMKYGVPVAASGVSSIPEICGDAALYFDPYNIQEIANRILQLQDSDIYNQLQIKSLEHYRYVAEKQKNDLDALLKYLVEI